MVSAEVDVLKPKVAVLLGVVLTEIWPRRPCFSPARPAVK